MTSSKWKLERNILSYNGTFKTKVEINILFYAMEQNIAIHQLFWGYVFVMKTWLPQNESWNAIFCSTILYLLIILRACLDALYIYIYIYIYTIHFVCIRLFYLYFLKISLSLYVSRIIIRNKKVHDFTIS